MTVNETTTLSDVQATTAVTPSGPGRRLREARESAGLTLEAVAMHLRLRQDLIQALEEDDSTRLPARAFVNGYVRSYARLLGLPGEELVAMLDKAPAAATLVMPVMPPPERRSSDLSVKAVTYGLVLVLAVLLGVWWFNSEPQRPPQAEPQPPEVQPQSQAQPQEPVAEPETMPAPSSLAAPGTIVNLPLPPAAPLVTPEPAQDGESVAHAATPAAAAANQAVTMAELLLEATSGESWIDVADATGKQLMFGMLAKGTTRTLRGKAPFSVFLGYAPAVTVYYQGQQFDHTTFQRRDVARFRLGKAADNKTVE